MSSPSYESLSSLLVEEYPDPLPTFLSGTRISTSLVISLVSYECITLLGFCSGYWWVGGERYRNLVTASSPFSDRGLATYEDHAHDSADTADDAPDTADDARYSAYDVANSDNLANAIDSSDADNLAADDDGRYLAAAAYDARDPTDAAADTRTTQLTDSHDAREFLDNVGEGGGRTSGRVGEDVGEGREGRREG
ncbi:hypothetical protein EV121DRAFT_274733 [Schizophyllum commune]